VTGARRMLGPIALAATAVAAAGCLSTSPTGAAEAPAPRGPTVVYAALGGGETAGFDAADPQRQAWPLLFAHSSLPAQTVIYDLAGPGETVADALVGPLPAAVGARPDVITVFLGSADALAGTPPATFGAEMTQLLRALHQDEATDVLVADMPPLQQYPVYSRCQAGISGCPSRFVRLPRRAVLGATVLAYDNEIAGAARAARATVVPVGVVLDNAMAAKHAPTTGDDFDLTTSGQQVVAAAFERSVSTTAASAKRS
jgi:lysophospholipase L1-like esterase